MKEELKEAIVRAVVQDAGEENALLFSGGVDSTVIAKILKDNNIKFRCYTAGFQGAEDMKFAEMVAIELGLELETVEIKDLEKTVKNVVKVIETKDVVMVSIAIPFYVACSKIKERVVFSGLGSEEIFAGYRMHRDLLPKHKAIQELSWKRLEQIHETDIDRDKRITSHFGLTISLPYLNSEVITTAMKIPVRKKISKKQNKIILREIAKDMGVPEFAYERKKRAAQYGSGAMRELKKLAKSRGHRYVKDYLAKL